MSDDADADFDPHQDVQDLRVRNAELVRRLDEMQASNDARIVRAEMKAEAIRAGMVDLDGLKLVDEQSVQVDENGEVQGARAAISQLRRNKPWLFGHQSSSSANNPPASGLATAKLATEMTLEEWRAARAELVRRR